MVQHHLLVVEVHGVFVGQQVTLGHLDYREFADSWMVHLRCRVLLKQMSYYGFFRMSWRYNSYKSVLLIASPNRHAPILPQLDRYPLRLFTKTN